MASMEAACAWLESCRQRLAGNTLIVQNGAETIGEVVNNSAIDRVFDVHFPLRTPPGEPLYLTLKTREVFSPLARGTGSDGRVLGFALSSAELS